ncbi:MAG: tRNA (adenosine(37)-N6)-dimethylallyltransferase MiaA [Spirochaetota bacterium]|nr:tRNA (adenosine(37)-N6)-dimethylallyltransferase MiaA [Spirochaetota bacterium]
MNNKAVVLVGPTASGKTNLSLEIAQDIFEIVSVDSAQVYTYMDIGTGKVSPYHRSLITHYCIDIVNPDYWFTAGDFCREAEHAIQIIQSHGKIPLFVGGTGLYIHAYFYGLAELPKIDSTVKKQLQSELEQKGLKTLYEELLHCDLQWAKRIHPNDTQRILRGLEVYRATGIPITQFLQSGHKKSNLNILMIALDVDRNVLYKRIENRVDEMIRQGFVEEVKNLRAMGYTQELNSQKAIGYLQLHRVLTNELSLNEAIEQIKQETKHYAKRQVTWFKRYKPVWVAPDNIERIKGIISEWLYKK